MKTTKQFDRERQKRLNNQQALRNERRAEVRWRGAMKILNVLARGVDGLEVGARGGFQLQQKCGI